MKHEIKIAHYYEVECYDPNGNLKWDDSFENLVVTVGRNHYLNSTLTSGSTPAWYVGLKGTGTPAASDTMASHGSWSEIQPYSNATRPSYTPGLVSGGSVDNSASKASFSITGSETVYGAFLCDNSAKGVPTGILLGAGDFAASRSVEIGDTLNVTVTCSITST